MMQRRMQSIVSGLYLLVCASLAFPAHAQASALAGRWSRHVRPNGESWIYHFTVTDGAAAETSQPAGALSGGSEARPVERNAAAATSDAALRTLPRVPPVDDGAAAGGVDIAVTRAYIKTATGGGGDEVATPAVGQTVYFYVDFSLTGATSVYIISRRAVFDGDDFCSTTQTTGNGSYRAWCANGWTATAGDHTLRWDVDYNNMLNEIDETNNSASATWRSSPTEEVDIEARRAYLRTAAGGQGDEVTMPMVGQTIYFHVDFRVVGTGGAIPTDRRAVLDGESFCSFIGTAEPGNYYGWCTDGWRATAGDHTLRWDFDVDNTVAESDEGNNSASVMWTSATTGGVDLEAQRAYLNTMTAAAGDDVTTPAVGQAVYFHLDYRLIGSDAVTVERRALLDGEPFCTFSGMSNPGAYRTWCVDAWTATAGSHTLAWDLDLDDTVEETDESNNSASTAWTTGDGSTCAGDCDGDGVVLVDELIRMVGDALSDTLMCTAGDADNDGKIGINDIIVAVTHALNGCT